MPGYSLMAATRPLTLRLNVHLTLGLVMHDVCHRIITLQDHLQEPPVLTRCPRCGASATWQTATLGMQIERAHNKVRYIIRPGRNQGIVERGRKCQCINQAKLSKAHGI